MQDNKSRHSQICKELNDIYAAKNHDYGDSFHSTYQKLGIVSALTRISDKCERLLSLCGKSEDERLIKNESIEDTLLDLGNYSIMTVMEMRGDSDS